MNKTYLMVPVKPVKHDLVSEIDKFIHVPLATYDTYGSVKIGSGLIVDRGVVSFDEELIPTELSELNQDSEHRLVTDSQIEYWDGKVNASELNRYYTKTESDSLLNEKTDKIATNELTKRVAKNETNIDVLTQNKANKSDIIDNLTTNNSNQMLSARQGYRLNNMINDINALLKSDNINLDTIQEIVNYIENNKDLIDDIMLTKVNISDVIDNLTTTDSTKPLSANQGVVLKEFIDALPEWAKQSTKPKYYYSEILERPAQVRVSVTKVGIPTKVSQLENDANYATEQFVNDFIPSFDFSGIEDRIQEVAESVPTKTSELQNDGDGNSPFVTETSLPDLDNYVTFDDYGTSSKAGVHKTNDFYGISQTSGVLKIVPALEREIDSGNNQYKPITPSVSDYAVKKGLTNPRSFYAWTEEEQALARKTLGIVNTPSSNITKTSDLENDGDGTSPFVTLSNTYTKKEVNDLVSAINGMKKEIVEQLPTENIDENTIYLVPKTIDGENDYYDEYLYINDNFEFIGSTQTDLDNYVTFDDIAEVSGDYGLVKLGNTGSGIGRDKNGAIYAIAARDDEIQEESQSSYRNLQPRHISKVVKKGLINSTVEWTEEEKALAQATLGITALVGDINTALESILGV